MPAPVTGKLEIWAARLWNVFNEGRPFSVVYPILVLHSSLLPLNVFRLRQQRRLSAAVQGMTDEDVLRSLVPYMNAEQRPSGSAHSSWKSSERAICLRRPAWRVRSVTRVTRRW